MELITTSDLRANLRAVLDRVDDDHEPVAIRRGQGRGVVILDADDYASLVETLHLVKNPKNAERLREGMAQHRAGQVREIDVAAYLD
jgi:antitoxin YefM